MDDPEDTEKESGHKVWRHEKNKTNDVEIASAFFINFFLGLFTGSNVQ